MRSLPLKRGNHIHFNHLTAGLASAFFSIRRVTLLYLAKYAHPLELYGTELRKPQLLHSLDNSSGFNFVVVPNAHLPVDSEGPVLHSASV